MHTHSHDNNRIMFYYILQFTVRNHPHFGVKVAKNVIKHGRELRLQSYNNYRKRFNLQPFQSFEQLTG